MRTSRLIAALGASTLMGGSALADFTVNPADAVVTSAAFTNFDISGGVVGTSYSAIDISLDWTDFDANGAFSQEAGFGVSSAIDLGGTEFVPGIFGQFEGDDGTANPATLTFSATLNANYIGGDDLFLVGAQQFAGYDANWSNISVTLIEGALPTFTLADTDSAAHGPGQWSVWDLVIDADGTDVQLDTLGSSVAAGASGRANDTEIFLIDQDGVTQLLTNDDIDFGGGIFESSVTTNLDAGTYTVVAGTFNLAYDGSVFTSDNDDAGTLTVNASTVSGTGASLTFVETVPEPGSLALLGLGGLAMLRRRRSA